LVRHAHDHNLWISFCTLDGATAAELSSNGWFRSYNFGSKSAAQLHWDAACRAGADYIASDQYEDLGAFFRAARRRPQTPWTTEDNAGEEKYRKRF
jgi:hypothetical protein